MESRRVIGLHGGGENEWRRVSSEVIIAMSDQARRLLSMPWVIQLLLAIAAGSFICFGAALSVFLTLDISSKGALNLMAGLGFSAGFMMVIMSGAALFTEVNVTIPVLLLMSRHIKIAFQAERNPPRIPPPSVPSMNTPRTSLDLSRFSFTNNKPFSPQGSVTALNTSMIHQENESGVAQAEQHMRSRGASIINPQVPKTKSLESLKFWLTVYLGNLIGALLVGGLLNAGDAIDDDVAAQLGVFLAKKQSFYLYGAKGWFMAFASAICGNWLVGMAAFNATSARTVEGKIFGIFFPILAFVSMGLQHTAANMGYFAIALWNGLDVLRVGDFILYNLIPASIGNIIGGGVFVATIFYASYVRWGTQIWHYAEEALDDVHPAAARAGRTDTAGSGCAISMNDLRNDVRKRKGNTAAVQLHPRADVPQTHAVSEKANGSAADIVSAEPGDSNSGTATTAVADDVKVDIRSTAEG